ncbi:MAG: SDR family NAD(P)-dependent oxidoreductase [Acidobacteria bacterium]|nr:MAG: SDR family NAD(P)-dependent oxidoreductase [Acidobacteriota bacterium]
MREIAAKRALITGGARGLGLEIGIQLAGRHAEVILVDRDADALGDAVEMVAAAGAPAHGYPADVTDAEAVRDLSQRIAREVGPIDLLVNNAGIVHGGPFLEVPLERHLATFRVNIEGVVIVTHAFLPMLLERPEAHIVQIASASGFLGLPYGTTYAASKWAAVGFAESLRAELRETRRDHVRVTIVCPSYIGTGMFEGVRPPALTRMLEPEEVARRVVEAVLHDRPWVLEPWLVKITPALFGLLPTRVWDALSSALGASASMTGWKGHGTGDPTGG